MTYEGQPGRAFVDLELVQTHLDLATTLVADAVARSFREGNEGALRHLPSLQFDSPLEVVFWIWWDACIRLHGAVAELFELKPQAEVRIGERLYRVDFLLEPVDQTVAISKHWTPIAIELDGHAFHERTREQVAYRDQRDRALQAANWTVLHFSFSEFTNNPYRCVCEVLLAARKQWNAVVSLAYADKPHAG